MQLTAVKLLHEKSVFKHNKTIKLNSSLPLARKYAWIFVCGHYLFKDTNSFLRAWIDENCELWGTDNVQEQISKLILAPNGDNCVYYPSNIFLTMCCFENWGRSTQILSTFSWGIFGHVMHLHQPHTSKKITFDRLQCSAGQSFQDSSFSWMDVIGMHQFYSHLLPTYMNDFIQETKGLFLKGPGKVLFRHLNLSVFRYRLINNGLNSALLKNISSRLQSVAVSN